MRGVSRAMPIGSAKGTLLLAMLATVAACASGGGAAPTQQASTPQMPPFDRLMRQRMSELSTDTQFVRAFGEMSSSEQLFNALPRNTLGRLSNAELVGVVRLTHQSLSRASHKTCTAAVSSGFDGFGRGFAALVLEMDSTLAVQWVAFIEKVMRSALRGGPIGDLATQEDVEVVRREMQSTMMRIDRREKRPFSTEAASRKECEPNKMLLEGLLRLPDSRLGPFMRSALFNAPRSSP